MRVGVDYTPAVRQWAGVGRYTRELVKALLQAPETPQFTLLISKDAIINQTEMAGFAPQRLCRLPLSERALQFLWHRLQIPWSVEQWTGPIDIFHSTNFTLPPLRSARGIVTVHDLAFMRLPECAEPGLRRYLSKAVPASLRRAHHVLADSEATRQDLIELLQVPEGRISVAYCGEDERFRQEVSQVKRRRVREKHQLSWPYFLSVCTIEPRKNLRTLIAAFAQAQQDGNWPHHLVLAGARGWLTDCIYRAPADFSIEDKVHFLGKLDDEDLVGLYAEADVFVFPSLYEGFGLPPLEALAIGTPVIANATSSLPEVVGDAGLLVQATDPSSLAEAMSKVLSDTALQAELRRKGPQQAAKFTWQRTAQVVLAAYQQVRER